MKTLSLCQLISPLLFTRRVMMPFTASHANLLARLPEKAQAAAYEQCWRKDWQDKEPHLLPVKHLSAWIQTNFYLSLADAPFDREDPTLNPAAGACTFERILENAPAMFTAAQLRIFLRALVNLDPYDFAEDVATYFICHDENNQQTPEEILASILTSLPDEKLTSFALRFALTGHMDIRRESDFDFLAEAESVFVPLQTKKGAAKKKATTKPLGAKSDSVTKLTTKKTSAARKKIAA